MLSRRNWGWVALSVLWLAGAAGCGTPGAPQPPSLNLPEPVTDLSADRAGDQVTLTWTMPKKNTDKLRIKDNVTVRVCRREIADGPCVDAGPAFELAPGSDGAFTDRLPAVLASGTPRVVDYFVELKNRKGRSAGLSNAVPVAAGAPPAAVLSFRADVQKEGVMLSWTPDWENAAIRLQRKLLTPLPAKPKEGLTAPPPEPVEQDLLIEDSQQGRALDKNARFGETYEYRAQRVARVTAEGKTFELSGAFCAPVRIDVRNVLPPSVPTGLVAVATAGGNGSETAIDLSWQPDSEADMAGYVVYRREGDQAWERISPAQPVVGPAFHDPHVEPGHTYRYAVSAVDQDGHESARSDEAQETVPDK
jgi:hypothetical protein